MNRWRSIGISLLGLGLMLLAGCVYDYPYYEDPVSPNPYFGPPGPPPPRRSTYGYHYLDRPEPYLYRQTPNRSEPYLFRQRPLEEGYYTERPPVPGYSDRPRYEEEPPQSTPRSREELSSPQKSPETKADTQNVPLASRGSKPGRVKVPFPPYNELDVSGLAPGSLAKDPTTGKIFRIPR